MEPNDRQKAALFLEQSPWLSGRGDLIGPLLEEGRLIHLAPGQWAQAEGDDDTGLLVIVSGSVQMLCQAPGDRDVLIGQAGAGVAIGQTMRFGGGPRLVTVVCAEAATLLQISDRALGRIAARHPSVWEAVAALLYLQLRGLLHLIAEVSTLPPRQRVASRLELLSRTTRGGRLKLGQQALAEMTGLSRKTVNGYLGEFERLGAIRRAYGEMEVLEPSLLRRIAEL